MRDRKQIENDAYLESPYFHLETAVNGSVGAEIWNIKLLLEVMLDIRDLMAKEKES